MSYKMTKEIEAKLKEIAEGYPVIYDLEKVNKITLLKANVRTGDAKNGYKYHNEYSTKKGLPINVERRLRRAYQRNGVEGLRAEAKNIKGIYDAMVEWIKSKKR